MKSLFSASVLRGINQVMLLQYCQLRVNISKVTEFHLLFTDRDNLLHLKNKSSN